MSSLETGILSPYQWNLAVLAKVPIIICRVPKTLLWLKHTHTHTIILWPLQGSTFVSWHPPPYPIRGGVFCWCKVYYPHVQESLQIDKFLSNCWYHVLLQRYVQSKFKVSPKRRFFASSPWGVNAWGKFGPNFSNSSHKWIYVQVCLRSIQWSQRLGIKKN